MQKSVVALWPVERWLCPFDSLPGKPLVRSGLGQHWRDGRFGHARKQGNPRSNGEDGFQISLCALRSAVGRVPYRIALAVRRDVCNPPPGG